MTAGRRTSSTCEGARDGRCGAGWGLAFAGRALAERGARVTLADVDADVLAASTQALADRGLHARAEVGDVTDADAVQAAVDRIVETEGRLDVVFANAGIGAVPGYAFDGGQKLDAIRSRTSTASST